MKISIEYLTFLFEMTLRVGKTEKNFPSFNKKELSEIEFPQKPLKLCTHKKIITNFQSV